MHGKGALPLVGSHEGMGYGETILSVITDIDNQTDRKALQLYNVNKQSYGKNKLVENEMRMIREYADRNLIKTFSHCPFGINLARDSTRDKRSFGMLKSNINYSAPAGISSVCHIGHHLDQFTTHNVCETLSNLEFRGEFTEYPLLLENAAGDGSELGVTWDELAYLAQNTDPNIGFCIDTQHLFATGQFNKEINLYSVNGVNELFKKLDRILCCQGKSGLERLRLFHLNDSRYNPKDPIDSKKYCTKKDAHANISCGYIWGEKEALSGLRYLLLRGGELNIPFITETKPKKTKGMLQDPEVVYSFLRDGE